jgi:putative ABC transport system permease protein
VEAKFGDLHVGLNAMRNEVSRISGVESVSWADSVPGKSAPTWVFRQPDDPDRELWIMDTYQADAELPKTIGMQLTAGRLFRANEQDAFVINQAAVHQMGWTKPEEAVDQPLNRMYSEGKVKIVGVVADFNFESLHAPAKPLIAYVGHDRIEYVLIRLSQGAPSNIVSTIQDAWETRFPGYPFNFSFVDDDFARLYEREVRAREIFQALSTVGVLLAALGLFGVTAHACRNRTKEIGIRKTLGASVGQMYTLLTRESVQLIVIGNLIAWPIVYLGAEAWLSDFAYRINFGWDALVTAATVSVFVGGLSVTYLVLRSARLDPAMILRERSE